MARYAPALKPVVLKALHHEAKRLGVPMTRLADECLTQMLSGTPGWKQAQKEWEELQREKRPRVSIDPE